MPTLHLPRMTARSARLNSTLAVSLAILAAIVSPGIRATAQTPPPTATVSNSTTLTLDATALNEVKSSTGTSSAPAGAVVTGITSVVLTGVYSQQSSTGNGPCGFCNGLQYTSFILKNNSSGAMLALLSATGSYLDDLTGYGNLNHITITIQDGASPAPDSGGANYFWNGNQTVEPSSYWADSGLSVPPLSSQIGGGTVDLPQKDGSATLASTFNNGAADGTWTLYMMQSTGDETYMQITGWTVNMTYKAGSNVGTTTTVTSGANPAIYSTTGTVTFTAKVTGTTAAPSGSVTFTDTTNNVALCSNVSFTSTSGNTSTATCSPTTSTLGQGLSGITAKFNPNTGFAGSQGSLTNALGQSVAGQLVEVSPASSTTSNGQSRWCNNVPFTDPGNEVAGQAYPSVIPVSGLSGSTVLNIGVELLGINTTYLGAQHMLVGPGGSKNLDFEDGGFGSAGSVSNLNLYFADAGSYFASGGGSTSLSTAGATPNSTTDWKATDANANTTIPIFASSSAPSVDSAIPQVPAAASINYAPPDGSSSNNFKNSFQNIAVNGDWALYVFDTFSATSTTISGWCLDFTLGLAPTITTNPPSATFTVGQAGPPVQMTATGNPSSMTWSETPALPAGLTLSSSTGVLSGTPAAGTGGQYTLDVTASNGISPNGSQTFLLTVDQPPAITTNPASTTFTVGTNGSYQMTATGYPAPTFSAPAGSLPAGVTLSTSGLLSGTPAAGTGSTYIFTVTANNGIGTAALQTFTLTVQQAPSIATANATTFTAGQFGSFNVTATGNPTPSIGYTGTLPGGVTLTTSGLLSGTPNPGTGGVYTPTITASNGVGTNATQSFTLTVDQAPAITSTNNATFTVGTLGSFQVTASGFPAPSLFVVSVGSLPNGVTMTTAGLIQGTPTGPSGPDALTIMVSNGIGTPATQGFTLTVSAGATATAGATASTAFSTNAQNVQLSATVTNNSSPITTGTVTFSVLQGTTVIGSPTVGSVNGSGVATVLYSLPAGTPAGTYTIQAVYNANSTYLGSSDSSHTLTVSAVQPTISWTPAGTIIVGDAGAGVLNASVNCTGCGTITYTAKPTGGPVNSITTTSGLAAGTYIIAANFTPGSSNYTANSATQGLTISGQSVWVVNGGGGTAELAGNGAAITSSAFAGANAAVAIDATGNAWTAGSGATLLEATSQTGIVQSTPTGGGLSAPTAIAIDGSSQSWIANSGNNSISLFQNNGTALSPSTGFTDSSLSTPSGIAVDLGGSVWVSNQGNNSVTRILGAAAPAAPLSTAAANNTTGSKP